jgi:predicted nicotinamide N-methyase
VARAPSPTAPHTVVALVDPTLKMVDQLNDNLEIHLIENASISVQLYNDKHSTLFGNPNSELGLDSAFIASKVWDSSHMLAAYFSANSNEYSNKQMLEIGSGTGYLGIFMKKLLPHNQVTISDVEEACRLMKRNVELNKVDVNVIELDWFDPPADFIQDCVIVCDCVYYPHLFDALIQTLVAITSTSTQVIFGYKQRTLAKESMFFDRIGRYFTFEPFEWSEFWDDWKPRGFVGGKLKLRDVVREADNDESFWEYQLRSLDV